ncbi:hypothetical protein FDUTEX481_00809 [Tolypothrix sp. PCC 7601]|nr:hypothetical protein FDUTEX481_00809 [Tolypothrix sp. PCC 7601]
MTQLGNTVPLQSVGLFFQIGKLCRFCSQKFLTKNFCSEPTNFY